jgi:hypothetical protein
MDAEWFYLKGDEKHGPITEDRLRELVYTGWLLPTDKLWRKGMTSWVNALEWEKIRFLKELEKDRLRKESFKKEEERCIPLQDQIEHDRESSEIKLQDNKNEQSENGENVLRKMYLRMTVPGRRMAEVLCPFCGVHFNYPKERLGEDDDCSNCGEVFTVAPYCGPKGAVNTILNIYTLGLASRTNSCPCCNSQGGVKIGDRGVPTSTFFICRICKSTWSETFRSLF